MVNDTTLPSSTPDMKGENLTMADYQPSAHENNPIVSVSHEHQQRLPSSYLSLSIGDNQYFGPSDFQEPLDLHYNQLILSEIGSGHETGDRIRVTNNFKLNKYRKQRSITTRKHRIAKSKSIHRLKKNRTKEKKKKPSSKRNLNKQKQKNKIINRSSIRKLRKQSKTRQQQISLKNEKKKLLKQCSASKKKSLVRLTDNRNTQLPSNKIKQTNISIFNPITPSNSKQMIILDKHPQITRSNILFMKKSSTKRLRRSKLNIRKCSRSKSKQIKQRNRRQTKLNIRSPMHTTFKKNVRRYPKRQSTGRKIKYPQCTSKTLITIGPLNENIIKPIDIKNDNIRTKISSSLFSLKNNLTNKQSTMPLTKNCAQLTSKNNNKRTIKIKRQGNSYTSKRKLKRSTRR